MDAEIHSVDTEKRDSEGQRLHVRVATIEVELKRRDGLPLGDHKDQHYLELKAVSKDGDTRSTLTAQLYAYDLQRLFEVAHKEKMIDMPDNR